MHEWMFVACMVRVHRLVVIRGRVGHECGVAEGIVRGPRVAIEVWVKDEEIVKGRPTFGGV